MGLNRGHGVQMVEVKSMPRRRGCHILQLAELRLRPRTGPNVRQFGLPALGLQRADNTIRDLEPQ